VCGGRLGDVYEGEFKADKRHGKGTYTYFSGDVYTGDWEVSVTLDVCRCELTIISFLFNFLFERTT
jgi:hypothetical protein